MAIDAARLSAALAGASMEEYAEKLQGHLGELGAKAFDKRAQLDFLKQVGVNKMGHRQKIVAALEAVATTVTPDVERSVGTEEPGASFWTSIVEDSAAATAAGSLELRKSALPKPPPAAVTTTPPPAAAVATGAAAPPVAAPPASVPAAAVELEAEAVLSLEKRAPSYPAGGEASGGSSVVDRVEVFRQRGNAAYGRQDVAAAARWYEKGLELAPTHVDLLNNLAACELARTPADPAAAMRRLVPLLAAHPEHRKARLRAGRCCLMLGDVEAARAHFQAVLSAQPPADVTLRWAPPPEAARAAPLSIGTSEGGADAALVQQAVEGRALASKLLSHTERSRALASARRLDESLYLARSVCRSCTHSARGALLVVGAYERSGRLWEAQREAEEAMERLGSLPPRRDPTDEAALSVAHARLLSRRGKGEEAEASLLSLLAAQPDCQRAARALRGMRAALRLKGEGNAHYGRGELERAGAAYTEALQVDCEGMLRNVLLGNRAQARLQEGRVADALADCDECLRLDAHCCKLLLRRAACHEAQRQPALARSDYARVLELEPGSDPAAEGLARTAPSVPSGGGGGEGGDDGATAPVERFDPYAVLGLAQSASSAEIKSAYRKLALQWHPDKHTGKGGDDEALLEAETRFKEINLAHDILTDPVKKQQHDLGGGAASAAGGRHERRAYAGTDTSKAKEYGSSAAYF